MPKYTFNTETLMFEVRDEPKSLKYIRIGLLSVAAVAIVCLYFWLYTSVFKWDLPKTAALKRTHADWEAKMNVLNRQLEIYDQTLTGIEQRDDDVYRSIYGLNDIPDEIKNSGLGGAERYALIDKSANTDLKVAVRRLDNLTKRAYVQSKALDEVAQLSNQAGDMVSCVPSVPPIYPSKGYYQLSSSFGYRRDPISGFRTMHTGQDFALKRGEPVFVTGDGVVETVQFSSSGYGNEVVVNHGYGYKTRYAHLNTIEVNEGMKVRRGDGIGTVGNTGKSTGPHLHYEVSYKGSKVNPMNYMDLTIPLSEYKSMTNMRKEESPIGKKSSTTELLRHSKSVHNE